jgi:hypothetical protein
MRPLEERKNLPGARAQTATAHAERLGCKGALADRAGTHPIPAARKPPRYPSLDGAVREARAAGSAGPQKISLPSAALSRLPFPAPLEETTKSDQVAKLAVPLGKTAHSLDRHDPSFGFTATRRPRRRPLLETARGHHARARDVNRLRMEPPFHK